jgi:hypothetical protein
MFDWIALDDLLRVAVATGECTILAVFVSS